MDTKYVMFDIADQDFQFFTQYGWDAMMKGLRDELEDSLSKEMVDNMDEHEVIENYFGEEVFWKEIP